MVFEISERYSSSQERDLYRADREIDVVLFPREKANDQPKQPSTESVDVEQKCRARNYDGAKLDQERYRDGDHHPVSCSIKTLGGRGWGRMPLLAVKGEVKVKIKIVNHRRVLHLFTYTHLAFIIILHRRNKLVTGSHDGEPETTY